MSTEGDNANLSFKDEITTYIYTYNTAGDICDQIHSEWTESSIYSGKGRRSYRTNKFAPFKIKKNCDTYLIFRNKFHIDEKEKKIDDHKIRVTINYSITKNEKKKYLNETKYVKFNVNNKYLIVDLKEIFFKEYKNQDEVCGGVHTFCSTINSWSYWMIVSENEKGRKFLACDHLTGG